MKYPMLEQFYSWQGEGVHMGRAAYFVRLMGCDQKCHFCDSAGTWHPDYLLRSPLRRTAAYIAAHARSVAPVEAFAVLTGGEPALHPLNELIDAFHDEGRAVHIETAGHRELPTTLDWITLSPKPFAVKPLRENIVLADEFKIIVEDEHSLRDGLDCVLEFARPFAPIWLHPEWSKRSDGRVLDLISNAVKANPRLRAGYQLHKLYAVDQLDSNAAKALIPLGGDPYRGSSQ